MYKIQKSDRALTHEECRGRLCLLCLQKFQVLIPIAGAIQSKLNNVLTFDNDSRLPKVVCAKCKLKLYRFKSSEFQDGNFPLPSYAEFLSSPIGRLNPDSTICDCKLCKLVRLPPANIAGVSVEITKKIDAQVEKRCLKCFSEFAPGKRHVCNSTNHIKNITDHIVTHMDPKEGQQVLSKLIQLQCHSGENTASTSSQPATDLTLKQLKGKHLRISVNPQPQEKIVISAEACVSIQNEHNLSFNTMKGIAKSLRTATQKRNLFEPGLKEKLLSRNHIVDEFFEIRKFNFTTKIKGKEEIHAKNIICCKNLGAFIEEVIEYRKNPDVILKFCVDGGGGFLKIGLSIQNNPNSDLTVAESAPPAKKLKIKIFKDAGVKKLLVLAIAPKVQENFNNIKTIWTHLEINSYLGFIATDLKLANILVGIMAHSSSTPCTWCNISKDSLDSCGEPRTIGNCRENWRRWSDSGAQQKNSRKYDSCIHSPIIEVSDDTKIIDVIPPPELHLMLGAVNYLVDRMVETFPMESAQWIEKCAVQREITHGGAAFTGNSCKKLLNNVDFLRSIGNLGCLPYVQAFTDLKDVVHNCFGIELRPDYTSSLDSFRESYAALNISVTPKVHAIWFHVREFCEKHQEGLGFYSEQAGESLHHEFNERWKKFKVQVGHPEHDERLLRTVCEFNSHHM